MNADRCGWIRRRLPLMAGGELAGQERRRVERHLIVCPGCRQTYSLHQQSLSLLHAAGRCQPVGAVRSLWPLLQRQIDEARSPHSHPFSFWRRAGLIAAMLGLMAAGGIAAWQLAQRYRVLVIPRTPIVRSSDRPVFRSTPVESHQTPVASLDGSRPIGRAASSRTTPLRPPPAPVQAERRPGTVPVN